MGGLGSVINARRHQAIAYQFVVLSWETSNIIRRVNVEWNVAVFRKRQ